MYYLCMETNSKPSLQVNLNYLRNLISKDAESLSELLAQKELSTLLLMSSENQEKFLKLENSFLSSNKQMNFEQFYLKRKQMWTALILKDPDKSLSIIVPIIQQQIEENYLNLENFILQETIH